MSRVKALCLLALTVWPFLFPLVSWSMERAGLLASTTSEPPLAFIIFVLLLVLTSLLILVLLVFYLVFLFTRAQLPTDHKLVWGTLLMVGHVFAMPIAWYLLIWNPSIRDPYTESTRFSLLVFAPLLLILLLPLAILFPAAVFVTVLDMSGTSGIELVQTFWLWVWILGPIIGASIIFVLGKSSHGWFSDPKLIRKRWFLLWIEFSLLSLPVMWFGVVVGRSLIPSDAPPNTPTGLAGASLLVAIMLQPLVLGWLYASSRLLQKVTAGRQQPTDT